MKASIVSTEAISLYNNALILSNKGAYHDALNAYRRAIDIYPDFIEAYNNIGEIYSRLGETSQAISTYMKALDIDRHYRILLNLGVEFYNKRDYHNALRYFLECLSLEADFIDGNLYAAMAYFNVRDLHNAERYFSKVIDIDRRHLKSNYLLSYINYEWKEYDKTLSYLDNIKDIADDRVFLNKYYGFCYYHLGRYPEAIEHLQVALESSPKYAQFKKYLSTLTYENKMKEIGDIDAKIKEMEETMMEKGASLRDHTQLSMLYIFKGEYKKAEDLLMSYKKRA
jgi:tetratricopeptide (TPR) repeat protein